MNTAQVHRFREKVALAMPGHSETLYITPEQAEALALAISEAARDTLEKSFTESNLLPVLIDLAGHDRKGGTQ